MLIDQQRTCLFVFMTWISPPLDRPPPDVACKPRHASFFGATKPQANETPPIPGLLLNFPILHPCVQWCHDFVDDSLKGRSHFPPSTPSVETQLPPPPSPPPDVCHLAIRCPDFSAGPRGVLSTRCRFLDNEECSRSRDRLFLGCVTYHEPP